MLYFYCIISYGHKEFYNNDKKDYLRMNRSSQYYEIISFSSS